MSPGPPQNYIQSAIRTDQEIYQDRSGHLSGQIRTSIRTDTRYEIRIASGQLHNLDSQDSRTATQSQDQDSYRSGQLYNQDSYNNVQDSSMFRTATQSQDQDSYMIRTAIDDQDSYR